MPFITNKEYEQRLTALQALIAQNELDIFIISSRDSIYYLTGASYEPLERPFFLLVGKTGLPILITPMLDKAHLTKGANIHPDRIVSYWEYPAPKGRGWQERLLELIDNQSSIGVEPSLTLEIFENIREKNPKMLPLVEELRICKSDSEIKMIRRAAHYADKAVMRLLETAYYGSLAIEGFAETSKITKEIIRDVLDYDPVNSEIIMAPWAAPRSAHPHSIPAFTDKLEEGPHVALVLTRVNGYSAEVERTFFTSEPDNWSTTAFKAMMEARRLAFSMIRPGQSCEEIDAVVNAFLKKEGFSGDKQRLHRTGHGFGLGAHEAPWIAEGGEHVLQKNMVVSNEPGIYKAGVGGIRHSDTVLVTEEGYECLTRTPTDIDSLKFTGKGALSKRLRGVLIRRSLRL